MVRGWLSQSPFADQQFDYILNILSPSNYSEFRRLLTSDGMLVKVIPGACICRSFALCFIQVQVKSAYSNDGTMELFIRHFERIEIR